MQAWAGMALAVSLAIPVVVQVAVVPVALVSLAIPVVVQVAVVPVALVSLAIPVVVQVAVVPAAVVPVAVKPGRKSRSNLRLLQNVDSDSSPRVITARG